MIDEVSFLGGSFDFEKGIKVYCPKVNDVVLNPEFQIYHKFLTLSQEEIEDQYVEQGKSLDSYPTPLEYILALVYHDSEPPKMRDMIGRAFQLFLHKPIHILLEQKMIIVGELEDALTSARTIEDLPTITEDNYFSFQNLIRRCCGDNPIDPPNPNEHWKIKEMKVKARLRDRIKAQSGKGISLGTTLASICCMGIGLTPLNIGELSYAAIGGLMRTFQEREKYDIDIRSLQAGAKKSDVHLKYWIRNIED